MSSAVFMAPFASYSVPGLPQSSCKRLFAIRGPVAVGETDQDPQSGPSVRTLVRTPSQDPAPAALLQRPCNATDPAPAALVRRS